MKKYLVLTTGFTLLCLSLYLAERGEIIPPFLHELFPGLLIFFFLQSLVIAWMFYEAEKTNWQAPIYVLGAITFRLLTGLFFLAILIMSQMENIKSLMVQFITLYLLYLIFELFAVLPNLRRN